MLTPAPSFCVHPLQRLDYLAAWACQEHYFHQGLADKEAACLPVHQLLLYEHTPTITLGKSTAEGDLRASEKELQEAGIEIHEVNRGGRATYHGPGQLVAYPILDLTQLSLDIYQYLRVLEQAVIDTLQHWGIVSHALHGLTGVWVHDDQVNRKICSIGIHVRQGMTLHGLALNVNTNMQHFSYINPCGQEPQTMVSMAQLLKNYVNLEQVATILTQQLLKHLKLGQETT